MPVTYKPTNISNSPFIRLSGTSACNIYIKVDSIGCESFAIFAQLICSPFPVCSFEGRSFESTLRVQRPVSVSRFCPFSVITHTSRPLAPSFCSSCSSKASHRRAACVILQPSLLILCVLKTANCVMPTKKISSNKSSHRRLKTGSVLNSRQEVTAVSTEPGISLSSTLSVSLHRNAESAEVSSSSIGQPVMDTLSSVVPN